MHTLENDFLKIEVSDFGAELRSVYDKKLMKERMWSGNPDIWGRVSPVLFPIVGKVKDGHYTYEGNKYELSQHGFLRDQKFELKSSAKDRLIFKFSSDETMLKFYPFKHEVNIEYRLRGSSVQILWTVKNRDNGQMFYSIGAHPGFSLDENKDYEFIFPKESKSHRYKLSEGLLGSSEAISLETMDVTMELFDEDAIIYDDVSSIVLRAKDDSESLKMNFKGFPYLGLWSVYDKNGKLPFVCIEPWHGIVDESDSNHEFTKKLGMRSLDADMEETIEYEMVFNER